MTGFETLPLLDQIVLTLTMLGGVLLALGSILILCTFLVIGLMIGLDGLLSWAFQEDDAPEVMTPRRSWFRRESKIILPYERQIAALQEREGIVAI